MFSVLADGPGRYRLEDGTGADAGWIRGKSIGSAACATRPKRSWPRQPDGERCSRCCIASMPRGLARTWLGASPVRERWGVRVGQRWPHSTRAPVPHDCAAAHGHGDVATAAWPTRQLAVEFVVPSWMGEDAMIPLAHALWHVLAPLLGETPRSLGTKLHPSHPAWLPWAHSAEVTARGQLLVG